MGRGDGRVESPWQVALVAFAGFEEPVEGSREAEGDGQWCVSYLEGLAFDGRCQLEAPAEPWQPEGEQGLEPDRLGVPGCLSAHGGLLDGGEDTDEAIRLGGWPTLGKPIYLGSARDDAGSLLPVIAGSDTELVEDLPFGWTRPICVAHLYANRQGPTCPHAARSQARFQRCVH